MKADFESLLVPTFAPVLLPRGGADYGEVRGFTLTRDYAGGNRDITAGFKTILC